MIRQVTLCLLCAGVVVTDTSFFNQRPHIVYVMADDLGWSNIGYHNPLFSDIAPTLDELASSGMILDRFYTFGLCRASFLSGRLPVHVNQQNRVYDVLSAGALDLRMTLLPEKLKAVGYSTHLAGKWHLGARSMANLPLSRGFNTFFGFLKGSEDHFTQKASNEELDLVDLWRNDGPAYGENGTYSTLLYTQEAVRVISEHDASHPLFLMLSYQAPGEPLQCPVHYIRENENLEDRKKLFHEHRSRDSHHHVAFPHHHVSPQSKESLAPWQPPVGLKYSKSGWILGESFRGMTRALDEGVSNVTYALQAKGMWEHTLFVFSTDNGAGMYEGGSNYPLRGGKRSDFEGGVRGVSFIAGGYLPDEMAVYPGLMHICDWYATLGAVAGVSHKPSGRDHSTHRIPPVDSLNMWPSMKSRNSTASPRTVIPLTIGDEVGPGHDGGIISGEWKLVFESDIKRASGGQWVNENYPDDLKREKAPNCTHGCLFNLLEDPSERTDRSAERPAVKADLLALMHNFSKSAFQTGDIGGHDECLTAHEARRYYRGYLGPPCFERGSKPFVNMASLVDNAWGPNVVMVPLGLSLLLVLYTLIRRKPVFWRRWLSSF